MSDHLLEYGHGPEVSITVSPFYYSAVNEITKPNSLVFTSHYFADRWMRELGPLGTAIVIALRSHCYQNRSTGELRNRIQIPVTEIAEEVGVSDKTVRREMEKSKALQRFVQRREEYAPGPTPRSLRTDAYSYLVAMDDPVHPLDEERLQEAIRGKARRMEKGDPEEDAKTRALKRQADNKPSEQSSKPPGQNDQAVKSRLDNLSNRLDKMTRGVDKLSQPPGQIVQTLKDSYSFPKNSLNSSPDFSHSLFGEKTAEKMLATRSWADLTPAEQQPHRDQAKAELHKYAVEAGPERWARIGPRQEEVRARGIYEKLQKQGGGSR